MCKEDERRLIALLEKKGWTAEAILQTVKELADKCTTLEEFREALARIIANK